MDKEIAVKCEAKAYYDIGKLIDFQGNLAELSESSEAKLRASLLKHGVTFAFSVWEHHGKAYLLDGHARMKVLLKMREEGYVVPRVPVVIVEAVSWVQAKEKLLLARSEYHHTTEQGLFDFIHDSGLSFTDLEPQVEFPGINLVDFGTTFFDAVAPGDSFTDPDDVPAVPEKPKSKPGDLYELGQHRLLCGSSVSPADVGRLMAGAKASMLFTDPPYNVSYSELNKTMRDGGKDWNYCSDWNDKMTDADYVQFLSEFLRIAKENLIESAHYYVWHATAYFRELINCFEANGIAYDKVPIIWKKQTVPISWAHYHRKYEPCLFGGNGSVTGNDRWFGPDNEVNVWEIDTDFNGNYVHPTQKPVALAQRALCNSSKRDEIVLEMFCGSGSTLIACEQMRRRCYAMEQDPHYIDVEVERYCRFTGRDSIILNGEPITWQLSEDKDIDAKVKATPALQPIDSQCTLSTEGESK